ncbi:hypothetical protein F6V25_02720 [Oryzomonas japonica]|uniref:Uncharacterized protein n=1 Tax=Oryzomonas japonica TaxID=2603858 RepID=A0A7J4ZVL3_9BACT|nr:hypothetical protein [Oryzomonas japonica]KAB0667624.1 hypothetical protein F6V25_02720 [Oryzomonas japonica]
MDRDVNLYNQGKNALMLLVRLYRQRGSYRIIRDPEGVISLWAIEGAERTPFSVSFADRGRISGNLEDMSPEFVRSFIAYVRKNGVRIA